MNNFLRQSCSMFCCYSTFYNDLRVSPSLFFQVYQIDNNLQAGGYLHYWDYYLYHANKGGHHNASKGRAMKQDAIRRARKNLQEREGGIGGKGKWQDWGVWDV